MSQIFETEERKKNFEFRYHIGISVKKKMIIQLFFFSRPMAIKSICLSISGFFFIFVLNQIFLAQLTIYGEICAMSVGMYVLNLFPFK